LFQKNLLLPSCNVESCLVPPKRLYVSARLLGLITVFMYDLLNDALSCSDGGTIALNGWMMVNNELVCCETGGRSLICGTIL
jgi:hypothetical protein